MTTLNVLSASAMAEYVAGLDLAQGSEAYRTMNTLLLLPQPTFARAISALAQGLVTLAELRALPAMNESLVNTLINGKLSGTDTTSLFWMYGSVWLPASISIDGLKANAIGSVPVYVAARQYDFWGNVVHPNYDFTGTDPTAYHSYNEAFTAYMSLINRPGGAAVLAVEYFRDVVHPSLRAAFPDLLQPLDVDCPVLQAIEGLLTQAYFLERPGGGRAPDEILDMIASAVYRNVSPSMFKSFMETVAIPAMIATVDADDARSGAPGAFAAFQANPFVPLPATGIERALDFPRMARVWLPSAYDHLVVGGSALDVEFARQTALLDYLDQARIALFAARDTVSFALPPPARGQQQFLLLSMTYIP